MLVCRGLGDRVQGVGHVNGNAGLEASGRVVVAGSHSGASGGAVRRVL